MVAKPGEKRGMYPESTRTTLSIDNDVLLLIRQRAEVTGESMGKAASDLIREAVQCGPERESTKPPFVLPRRSGEKAVTMELVNAHRDELP